VPQAPAIRIHPGSLRRSTRRSRRKRGYELVTIGEICDEANVGRSTFYAHYKSKERLLEDGLQHPD
jgi:AcrR family transcriptional regulator